MRFIEAFYPFLKLILFIYVVVRKTYSQVEQLELECVETHQISTLLSNIFIQFVRLAVYIKADLGFQIARIGVLIIL